VRDDVILRTGRLGAGEKERKIIYIDYVCEQEYHQIRCKREFVREWVWG
jgi:hypothetical protein